MIILTGGVDNKIKNNLNIKNLKLFYQSLMRS